MCGPRKVGERCDWCAIVLRRLMQKFIRWEGKEELKNCTEPGLNHKLTKMTGRVGSSPLTLKGSMAIVPACFAAGFNTLMFAFSSLPEMLLVCP